MNEGIVLERNYEDSIFYRYLLLFAELNKNGRSKEKKHFQQKYDSIDTHVGRPAIDQDIVHHIKYLFEVEKYSYRKIAEVCQVSLGTVHKYVHEGRRKNEYETRENVFFERR